MESGVVNKFPYTRPRAILAGFMASAYEEMGRIARGRAPFGGREEDRDLCGIFPPSSGVMLLDHFEQMARIWRAAANKLQRES